MRFSLIPLIWFIFSSLAHADIDQGKEAYFMGDYDRALEELLPEAQAGNNYAQLKIGFMYENGWGVTKNLSIAKEWYERAVAAYDPNGHVALAKLAAYGRGMDKNIKFAEALLLRAADLGFPHAYYVLADFHNNELAFGHNDQYALEYYLLAAKENAAASLVHGHYRKGTGQWFRLLNNSGIKLTRSAADNGNIYAQFNTGLRFYFGEGVTKNHTIANTYFLMAALSGNAEAQSYLAQNQILKDPINFDRIFAYKWFTISSKSGYKAAEQNRKKIKSNMTQEQINQAEIAVKKWIDTR